MVRIGLLVQNAGENLVELKSLTSEEVMGADLPPSAVSLVFTQDWVSAHLGAIPPSHVRILSAPSDRMRGQFDKGDLLVVDTRIKTFDSDGVFVFELRGSIWVQGVQRLVDGGIKILSANSAYAPELLGPSIANQINVIGVVAKVLSVRSL
jgi:phage repressor protein C with HTH and peptisase S24 domain